NSAMQHTLIGSPQPTMQTRAATIGYEWRALGENIAYGYSDAASVVNAWMNSAGHRANILNPMYTEMGAGVVRTDTGLPYYTQSFGQSLPSNPTGPGPVYTVPGG